MELIKKFDIRVFVVLIVLTIGVDYFNDSTFGQKDIISGIGASIIGTIVWGVFKNKIGF